MPFPTFVIVGAQKSGTTTLHDLLGQLPDAWMSEPKELHFFDKHLNRGLEWYAGQFQPGPEHVAWGESTPFYLYKDRARDAMVDALPSARFVAILREPVSRAYSHYWFARSKGKESLSTFAEAVAAEPERLSNSKDGQPAAYSYLDRGRYLRQLVALTERVGRERLLVHLMDDLSADPRGVLATTCTFVGLDPGGVAEVEVLSKNTFAERTVNSADGQSKRRLRRRNDAGLQDGYPPIDAGLAADLRAAFHEENLALSRWLGRDLSSWLPVEP
ncbi:MAG: sulfotransferase [Actinomycetia bacterium]|nr:sulfotransferase [Actinomycetes bacterium]